MRRAMIVARCWNVALGAGEEGTRKESARAWMADGRLLAWLRTGVQTMDAGFNTPLLRLMEHYHRGLPAKGSRWLRW